VNSKYYGLIGKVFTKPLSTVSIELESNTLEPAAEVIIDLDSNLLQRVTFDTDHKVTVHCTIDDSMASSNSKLQISMVNKRSSWIVLVRRWFSGCTTLQLVWIRSLKINGIDLTHMLTQHNVKVDSPVMLLVDKPLWAWMVNKWNQILPDSYILWHKLHKNK